ncbi:hypothetical protein [Pseudomonas sp. PLMAX]|uniref:hypothetical protein n=1 Tax=Pseudomonas sp. PLMAX TaxID=2201998 RepID=UPI0038B770AC
MTCYPGEGAQKPFDGSDACLKGSEPPPPARNWQHAAARTTVAYLQSFHELRDALSLKLWPETRRVKLINDLVKLIETHFSEENEVVSKKIFDHLSKAEGFDVEFAVFEKDEVKGMKEDIYAEIEEAHRLAIAA